MHTNLERVVRDLQEAKEKCDELRASKQVGGGGGGVDMKHGRQKSRDINCFQFHFCCRMLCESY